MWLLSRNNDMKSNQAGTGTTKNAAPMLMRQLPAETEELAVFCHCAGSGCFASIFN
jgi:hypothetical protein